MKKFLLILLSILICFAFSSCTSSNKTEEKSDTEPNNSVISENSNIDGSKKSSKDNNNNDNENKVTYKNKSVSNIQLDFNGYRTNLGTEGAQELFALESLKEAKNAEVDMELGSIIIIYDTGGEERYANVYMGTDKNFYLQLENDNSKIYKLADSSIMNDLF